MRATTGCCWRRATSRRLFAGLLRKITALPAGGIDGTLIAEKRDRRGAERGAVRRESTARAADLSWKRSGRLAVFHRHHRERATTLRLAPS
jgi:hypothetical protein